jgi:hypothetical protein
MEPILLNSDMKNDFLAYGKERHKNTKKNIQFMPDYYITDEMFLKVFDWFASHKLRVFDYGRTEYKTGKKVNVLTVRYIDYILQSREEMIDNLFHEVYCQTEWLARSTYMKYEEVCIQVFGYKFVKDALNL